jgi:hypothetical protein
MAKARSRQQLIEKIKVLLGYPILTINLTDDMINSNIDLVMEFLQDYHMDFSVKGFIKYKISQVDKDNKYIMLPPDLLDVSGVLSPGLPISGGIFSSAHYITYTFMLNYMNSMTSRPLKDYVFMRNGLEELDQTLGNKITYHFNPHTNRLDIQCNWYQVMVDEFFVIECYAASGGIEVWSDRILTELSTEYCRRSQGHVLGKFGGSATALNGVIYNYKEMIDHAEKRIEELRLEVIEKYSIPPLPMIY